MSHKPLPPLPRPNLQERGNGASGYGQQPLSLHQAVRRNDSQPASSDQIKPSQDDRSSNKQASKHSHPACLTPGHRVTPQESHPNTKQANHTRSVSLATNSQTPAAQSPTSDLNARYISRQPNALYFNTIFSDPYSTPPSSSTTTARQSQLHPAIPTPHCEPTPEPHPHVPYPQAIRSRDPVVIRQNTTNDHTKAARDGHLPLLTPEEEATTRGEVCLRGDGYHFLDTRYHPSISEIQNSNSNPAIPAVSAKNGTSERVLRPRRLARRRSGAAGEGEWRSQDQSPATDLSPLSYTDPQPSTPSPPLAPPKLSPPPRPSTDLIARNQFLAASQFFFERENVGRADSVDDGGEGDAKVILKGGNGAGAGAEKDVRRFSGLMQGWQEWGGELGGLEEWRVGLEGLIGCGGGKEGERGGRGEGREYRGVMSSAMDSCMAHRVQRGIPSL